MTTSTAVLLLAAAWAGSLLGLRLGGAGTVPWAVVVAAAVVPAALAVAAWRRRAGPIGDGAGGSDLASDGRRPTGAPGVPSSRLALLAALAVLLTAALGGAVRSELIADGPLRRIVGDRAAVAVQLTAVPVADVRAPPDGGRWVLARLVVVAAAGEGPVRSRERVVLRLPAADGPTADVPFGTPHRITGRAEVVAEGPGRAFFLRQGASVEVSAVDVVRSGHPPAWVAATTWLRDRIAAVAHDRLAPAPASLLTGLITGDGRGQPQQVGDDVTTAGLSHLVAVSGSNVAVVIAGVIGLALVTGVGRRAGWWAALAVVWWFVVLVRAEPSVVRAAATATLVLAAMLIGRVRHAPSLLCTAGFVALLADPLLAARPGFALSVTATAGVLVLAPSVATVLERHTPLPRPARLLLAATLGAQVAVAPMLIAIGGVVHPASVPANLVAVPAASVASAIGMAVAVVATVAPGPAGALALLARPALEVVLWSARTFASPGGQALAARGLLVVAVWIGWAAWRRLPSTGRLGATGRVVLPAIALVLVAVLWGLPRGGADLPVGPMLVVLDVGQGDALLLGDPVAGWVLVDGGPDPDVLAAALAQRRVGRLAAVVISHAHADHIAGLARVVASNAVGALVHGPGGEEAREVLAVARARDVAVVPVAAGQAWQHGSMQLTVLSPPPTGLGSDANDSSLVLRVDVAVGRSALLTGDAEVLAQGLLAGDPRLDVDVLKVPHHGGDTNADGFLASTTPDLALISVGEGNDFGHPHPDVLADLSGVEVRRTDLHGTVVVPLADP